MKRIIQWIIYIHILLILGCGQREMQSDREIESKKVIVSGSHEEAGPTPQMKTLKKRLEDNKVRITQKNSQLKATKNANEELKNRLQRELNQQIRYRNSLQVQIEQAKTDLAAASTELAEAKIILMEIKRVMQ